MEPNVGQRDKAIRTVVGASMVVAGTILLVTASTGFCSIYKLLGFSTCPKQRQQRLKLAR